MKMLKVLPVILVLLSLSSNVQSQLPNITINDAIQGIFDDLQGILGGVGLLLPSIDDIFRIPMTIFDLPLQTALTILNEFCALALSTDNISPGIIPDPDQFNLILGTTCNNLTFPIAQAENLWNNPAFNKSNPSVIIVHGYVDNANDSLLVKLMSKAYNCRGNYNIIVLDSTIYIDTLYSWSALNTKEIGRILAQALTKLDNDLAVKVHLIGHSLGAQIVGSAARYYFNMTGEKIEHITGLDPANPCFKSGQVLDVIGKGDANFVDIIHTNSGVAGKIQPLGDVDYYPNGLTATQPGCITATCSHARSYEYYGESVYPNNEQNFLAVKCTTLYELERGFCIGKQYPMGFAVPQSLGGNFFSKVNSQEPYGRNANADFQSSDSECGRCETSNS